MAPLKDLDVRGELTEARSCIEKLQRNVSTLLQDQDDSRHAIERRLQAIEAKSAAADSRVSSLESQLDELRSRNVALLEDLRQSTREAVADVIDRVAEQFEALQMTLDEAVGDRALEARERAAASKLIGEALTVQRQWTEEQLLDLKQKSNAAEQSLKAMRCDLEKAATVDSVKRATDDIDGRLSKYEDKLAQKEEQARILADTTGKDLLSALETVEKNCKEALKAASASSLAQSHELRTAVMVWQKGLEEQLVLLVQRFDQYRGYVKKLRKEVETNKDVQSSKSKQAQIEASELLRDLESIRAVTRS